METREEICNIIFQFARKSLGLQVRLNNICEWVGKFLSYEMY